MVRIYTKTGDTGTTALFSGKRVHKNHPLIDAYGTVDELSASIGVAISFIKTNDLNKLLNKVQELLFIVGTDLATPFNDKAAKSNRIVERLTDASILEIESWIDELTAKLPPLKTFILPQGVSGASFLHQARTVCRRAERGLIKLLDEDQINPEVLKFLNRLSDFLFVAARYENQSEQFQEIPFRIPKKI